MRKPRLLGPWRRLLQTVLFVLYFLLPLLRYHGESLIRVDIPGLALQFAGHRFQLEDMLFLWLAILAVVFLFVLITVTLGRVWCGWVCPQSIAVDLAESVARRLGLKVRAGGINGPLWRRFFLFLFFLGFSIVFGAASVWYFVPPYLYMPRLGAGALGPWPLGATLTVAAIMLVNLLFLRRVFCSEFCPYGRFQAALIDEHSLTLVAPPEDLVRCIHCQACVIACPVGIDIRNGGGIECIVCGRCLDACRMVMARLDQPGIIRFIFGSPAGRWWNLFSARSLVAGIGLAFFAAALVFTAVIRSPLSMKISRQATTQQKIIAPDRLMILYEGHLVNRSESRLVFRLEAVDDRGQKLPLSGTPGLIQLEPAEKIRLLFSVVTPMSPTGATEISIIARDPLGAAIGRQNIKVYFLSQVTQRETQ